MKMSVVKKTLVFLIIWSAFFVWLSLPSVRDNTDDNDSNFRSPDKAAPAEFSETDTGKFSPNFSTTDLFNHNYYDVCVVGAGLSGAVIAEQYATMLGKTSLVIDRRDHIGGNVYDFVDEETNILVNKYGAHLFHTKYFRVWEYLQQFSEWTPYEHRVLGRIGEKHVPIPVNIDTVNALFNLDIKSSQEMDEWLKKEQVVDKDKEPQNSEEMALSRVGQRLYDLIFKPYTIKQWAKTAKELGPQVTARIPVRNNWDDRYFSDVFQALPTHGYTKMFENIFKNPLIEVHTNVDYFDVRDKLNCGHTYFSGPIDAYFADLGFDKLEYRSLNFERKVVRDVGQDKYHLPASVVNYPSADYNFTRIVEYKHFLKQKSPHSVLYYERSNDDGEP
jgi:UDP-galactopyranose mutase